VDDVDPLHCGVVALLGRAFYVFVASTESSV